MAENTLLINKKKLQILNKVHYSKGTTQSELLEETSYSAQPGLSMAIQKLEKWKMMESTKAPKTSRKQKIYYITELGEQIRDIGEIIYE